MATVIMILMARLLDKEGKEWDSEGLNYDLSLNEKRFIWILG